MDTNDKKEKPQSYRRLFLLGFLQVFFITINTYFISKGIVLGLLVASFTISWIWSLNVKKISTSTNLDRLYYSLGATSGSVSAYYFGILIYNL
jgi:hypothetical protein